MHHGFGQWIRNNWSLWDKGTPLALWFREAFDLSHADDLSSMILEAVVAEVRGVPFDSAGIAERFHRHWRKLGVDPKNA